MAGTHHQQPGIGARFNNQAEVLIYARIAADLLGATPMDRPEWTTIGKRGEVFWTLTNNSNRTEANAANPEAPNNDGHIIRTKDSDDHLGTSFTWDIYLLASSTRGTEEVFTTRMLPGQTPMDVCSSVPMVANPMALQDQWSCSIPTKTFREPKRLLVGVDSDEITGFTITPDQRTAFVNIPAPGNGDPSKPAFRLPLTASPFHETVRLSLPVKMAAL